MNTNGNATDQKPLSPLLKTLLKSKDITPEVAEEANQLDDLKLQNAYLHGYRQGLKGGETVPVPEPVADSPKGEGGGFSIPTPKGKIGKAFKSIEKVAAWDMVGELEEWMAVKVPPYRAARRVFSWLWMAFGAEAMLATLITCLMLYGAFVGVRWGWRRLSESPKPIATQTAALPTTNPLVPTPAPTPPEPVQHKAQRHENALSQNAPVNQPVSAQTLVPASKPSYISAFTHQLLKNADGAISSSIPLAPVSQGVIAVKNAALTANDQAAPAAPKATIPIVTGIHADVISPEEIHLSWDYLGPGYTYNAYTDVEYEMKKPWKEDEKPLHTPGANWQPERGLDFYWLAVTAIDRNGHEGKLSEPIYVKVR